MPTALPYARFQRVAAELALWITVGLVMGVLGPFGSSERTLFERLIYWQYCMVGGASSFFCGKAWITQCLK